MANLKEDRIASLDKIIYLSSNISYLRKGILKTQTGFGKIFGYSDGAINNWEKGKRMPDAVDLAKIADYFDLTMDELMFKDLTNDKEVKMVSPTVSFVTDTIKEVGCWDLNDDEKKELKNYINYMCSKREK